MVRAIGSILTDGRGYAGLGGATVHISNESLLVILLVGLVAGWLAGKIVRGVGIRTHRRSHNRCCRGIHRRLVAASARYPSRHRHRLCDHQCHHWRRLTSARGQASARWWALRGRLGQTPMVVAREGDFKHRWGRVFTAAAFGIGCALSVCLEASAQPAPDYGPILSAPDRSDADRQADKRRDPAPLSPSQMCAPV